MNLGPPYYSFFLDSYKFPPTDPPHPFSGSGCVKEALVPQHCALQGGGGFTANLLKYPSIVEKHVAWHGTGTGCTHLLPSISWSPRLQSWIWSGMNLGGNPTPVFTFVFKGTVHIKRGKGCRSVTSCSNYFEQGIGWIWVELTFDMKNIPNQEQLPYFNNTALSIQFFNIFFASQSF